MTSPRQIVVISGSRHPHELVFMLLSILFGVSFLVTVPAPSSLASFVPTWLVTMWAAGFLGSGIVGTAAWLWRGRILISLQLERVALLANIAPLMLIGGALLVVTGWQRGFFAAGFVASWAVANLWRSRQITKDVKALASALESGRG